MSFFHQHKWVEFDRHYALPITFEADRISPDLTRELTVGTTHIALRCEGCGDVSSRKLLGVFKGKPYPRRQILPCSGDRWCTCGSCPEHRVQWVSN